MAILRDILGLPLDDSARRAYNANSSDKRISEVIIDGNKITGYRAFSFVRKLTYVESPKRGGDGSLGNLNSHAVFTTPELQIDFSLLFIDDYRTIMNLIYERREHIVECYDIVRDTRVVEKMYFEPEELPNLWTITRALQGYTDPTIELLGVRDYTIVMVGTNNPKETINVVYYDQDTVNETIIASEEGIENQEMLVGYGVTVSSLNGKTFNNAWYRRLGANRTERYVNNEAYSLALQSDAEKASRTISFYPEYKDTAYHILSLSYGEGEPLKSIDGGDVNAFEFVKGDTIGAAIKRAKVSINFEGNYLEKLPVSALPTVEINGYTYQTHSRLGWSFTPTMGANSTAVTENTVLNVDGNISLYQVFAPVRHTVRFVTNASSSLSAITQVPYGSVVALPTILNQGYTFEGWYEDPAFKTKFGGTMPPYELTLYAKWKWNS